MAEHDPVVDLHARAETIRRDLGGADKVARIRADGQRTVRDHIAGVLDAGSFHEIGTFSRSMRPEDRDRTPGDGKIGGHGTVDGRPVVVFGDDITVLRGSSSEVGTRKEHRLYERALAMGVPVVHFGQTGGGRIPDIMGSEGISESGGLFDMAARRHRIPMATAIVGQSFGGSSFLSALSDFVVMTRGSCLAVTSPRVFEMATGEVITFEEVGGVDVHARHTGQIDLAVEDDDEAYAAIRRWLGYLPSNAWEPAPRAPSPLEPLAPDPHLAELVPAKRTRAYDMRRVVERLCDPGSVMFLQPLFARSVVTALARIDGWSIGVIANNPLFNAGVLDPEACLKIIRLVTLCDAFNLPVVFLVDVPGFMVGRKVEHDRMLHWGMRMMQALQLASTPTLTVCLRKAFGLAWQAMNGAMMPSHGIYAWPGAEIGFMDPEVGVNVAFGSKLAALDEDARGAERARLVHEVQEATSPYEAAGTMRIDEIIDPALTRLVLAEDLGRLAHRPVPPPESRPLSYWPTC